MSVLFDCVYWIFFNRGTCTFCCVFIGSSPIVLEAFALNGERVSVTAIYCIDSQCYGMCFLGITCHFKVDCSYAVFIVCYWFLAHQVGLCYLEGKLYFLYEIY